MQPNIFRLYDIRGKYPEEVDENIAYLVGYYFGMLCEGGQVIVGFDGRLSSPSLYNPLVQGIIESGSNPLSVGLVPTPLLYFANKKTSPAGAIIITASHNPKEDNGFKMILDGESFFGDGIIELRDMILASDKKYTFKKFNEPNSIDFSAQYIDRVLEDISVSKDLKVAWDPGNGASGEVVSKILNHLPNTNIMINEKIDGNFPNRPPDPTIPANLTMLLEVMEKNSCDLGIALDGDADRVVFVTSTGRILPGDQTLCIFAEEILKANPGATVIAEVKSSQILFDYINDLGGKAIMSKTGHAIIKHRIRQEKALLAGEMSGHIFFADKYYGYDDGIYAALRMIDLLSKSQLSLEELVAKLPPAYNTAEIKLRVLDSEKFIIIDEIKAYLKEIGRDFIDIDGIRCKSGNGWWLIRASNTEATLTVRCEALSETALVEVKRDLDLIVSEYGLSIL